jgi:putative transposase
VSTANMYSWRKKYRGMEAGDLKHLRTLEEDNAKLTRLYAELVLDHELAREIIVKKL